MSSEITKKETSHINPITEGNIGKEMIKFFLPLVFGTFFQLLYNTADSVIVGRYVGKEALAAVGGSAAILVNVFVGGLTSLSSGATVIIGQYYGAGRKEDVSRSVHTGMAFAILLGILHKGNARRYENNTRVPRRFRNISSDIHGRHDPQSHLQHGGRYSACDR